jgi:hypothetical protein
MKRQLSTGNSPPMTVLNGSTILNNEDLKTIKSPSDAQLESPKSNDKQQIIEAFSGERI